jgi:hypothetical protein
MSVDLEERLLAVLDRHWGRENCIGMGELWRKVFRLPYDHRINDTSELRRLIRKLRRRGEAICSISDKFNPGYYLAETPAELEEFAKRHERRGLTSLVQVARLRRIALPELLGQLQLSLEGKP